MPPARLTFYLLGSPRLERDGTPIQVDTRKATALAIYLGVTGEAQARSRLAALFWPEADAVKAHAALRRTLSVLNKALGGTALVIDREQVRLGHGTTKHSAALWLDVDEFHHHLAACLAHGHPAQEVCPACLPPLTAAAALYRDDFLAGFTLRDSAAFDDWQFFQSESLRRELAGALEKLVLCQRAANDPAAALPHARRWLGLDTLHEPAHRQVMLLYAQTGQRAAALRQYQECAHTLNTELGVPPLAATTQLYEAIKENRWPGPPAASPPPPPLAPLPPHASPHYPLVGRATEWAALLEAYAAIQQDGRLLVLEGEAGVGKTRLAEAFLEHLRQQGRVALNAHCYEGEVNLAYGPFVEALRLVLDQPVLTARLTTLAPHRLSEVARLLPELAHLPTLPGTVTPPPPLDSPGAQSRFFESLLQMLLVLGEQHPPVIFLDDLQWADEASLDLLTYLARRLPSHRLCLLVTWRSDHLPAHHRLRQLLVEAQRARLTQHWALTRLSPAAVTTLAQAALPQHSAEMVARLYRETEGLPLFVIEYLKTLAGGSTATPPWAMPGEVRGLLLMRLAQADPASQQLLAAAAVIGRAFDLETLQAVSGRSEEETLNGLEALLARGLVREMGEVEDTPTYDFNHEKLRELVYAETSLARRRLLHRRAAETLLSQGRGRPRLNALASQVALHYRLGGLRAEAAHYYQLAGEHAHTLYANAEALTHLRAALDLGHPAAASLHEAIGDLLTLAGDYPAALASYAAAAALVPPEGLAELEHKLGAVYQRRGEGPLAERHFQVAFTTFGAHQALGGQARVLADWSLVAHHQGQTARAQALAHQALALAETAADQRALAQAHNLLGILASHQHDLPTAQAHLENSLALAEALGDDRARVATLNNLALAFGANGQTTTALGWAEQALALCTAQGDRHRAAALHNNLADLLHTAGHAEAAMAHLKQAVTLFAEVGKETSVTQPEIWKLTEW